MSGEYGGPQFKTNGTPAKNVEPIVNELNDKLIVESNIVDKDGNEAEVTENGSLSVAIKENFESEDTLSEILAQLKIMNLHLSLLTDITINKTEVE
jgi:hypothetical protein